MRLEAWGRTAEPSTTPALSLAFLRVRPMSLRQLREPLEFAADQGFLLRARPAFYLSFRCDGISDAIEPLRKYQSHGASRGRVATIGASVVLGDPIFQVHARGTYVIALIGAQQDVEIGAT